MRLHLFILLLLTSLCFGVDFNAKTEENRAKIMELCINSSMVNADFEKYKNNLWLKDETFLRKLLKNAYRYNLDDIMKNVENKNILNDKELFLKLIQRRNGHILKFSSENLKNNKEFMLRAAGLNSYASYNEIMRLKEDMEVVLKSVGLDREAVKYLNQQFKNDKEVAFETLKGDTRVLAYASTQLKNDKEFVLKIINKGISALAYAGKNILNERDTVFYYLKKLEKYDAINHGNIDKHHSIFKNIAPFLLDDEEVMSKAVSVFGISLQYASKRLKKNKEIIILALKNNPKAHQYIPYKMRKNKDVLKMLMSQNTDGYMQNKIKRKVKPLAWESYDINETLEILYGKDRVYETSKDIDIKLPKIIYRDFDIFFKLNTNKKVKSIAILQKKEGDRALVALYYPYGNIANITLPLKILHNYTNMDIEGMRVVVITETEDNHLFINEYTTNHEYGCMNGENPMDYHLKWLKNNLNVNSWKRKRYKIDEKGVGYLELVFLHPMLSYEEAEKINTKVNFIAHISGRIQDKRLFDLYTSEYIRADPRINLVFENMKQDERIELSYTTIDGTVKSKHAKPRKMKKKSH